MKKRIISGIIVFCLTMMGINGGLQLWLPAYGADDGSLALIYNNKTINQRGYVVNGTPYLPVSMIGKYVYNPGITVDQKNKKLIIDLSSMNIMMADEATTNFVKTYAGNVYIPLRDFGNGDLYFPLNTTEQFFRLGYTITGNTIRMRDYTGTDKIAKVNRNGVQGVSSLFEGDGNTVEFSNGETVFITGETDNYYAVTADDGSTVYIMKEHVSISEIDLSKIDFYAPKKPKFNRGNEKISLAWDYVHSVTPAVPAKYSGLDILSPTWFDLIVEGGGNVENLGDKGYTDTAHANGYMVWATITNSFSTKGSTAFTTKTFNNSSLMNKAVAQFIFYSCLYDVDGINIDFEDVADADAAGLVAFTALLRNYTERQGLVLSIDTLIPRPWTIEYDRAALSKYVDYLAVMTYDEHYSSSPVAGSVASLPWVESAVKDTLKDVPASKLLLGVPLYTRLWTVDSAGKIIKNPAMKMPEVRNLLGSMGLTPVWLDKEKQYYAEYPDGAYTTKIWIEDSRSIANRLNLVKKYNLAGAACWQLRQGEDRIWDVFDGMLKRNKSLKDYENPY